MRALHGLDADDLRYIFLDDPLDTVGERQLGHRASTAGTDETDLHDAVFGDLDELDVPAIGLKGRADPLQRLLYALLHAASFPVSIPGRNRDRLVYVSGF
jgi:hypothetical protein